MTRAKKKLIIVTDKKYFRSNSTPSVRSIINNQIYTEPNKKTLVMGLSDLYMSFLSQHDAQGIDLIAGSQAYIREQTKDKPYHIVQNDIVIAQLSKKMQKDILTYEEQGYSVVDITIENIIEWFDEKNDKNRHLPLCKLSMYKPKYNFTKFLLQCT